MATFLKYLGAFCLLSIALSLAFCSFGVYNGLQTANRIFAGADNYTCRQFMYDMEHPDTDKFAPMLIAAIAYGSGAAAGQGEGAVDESTIDARQNEIVAHGVEPAVSRTYALCRGKPNERVLNAFAQSLVSPSTVGVSSISSTQAVSATVPAENK